MSTIEKIKKKNQLPYPKQASSSNSDKLKVETKKSLVEVQEQQRAYKMESGG